MRWYTKAQIVPRYEPAPSDTPVDVVNNPVKQITKAEWDWSYAGRDADGEKIYYPLLHVTYKDGKRFQTKGIFGHKMEEVLKQYHAWCKEENLVPVPPTDAVNDMEKEYQQSWKLREQEEADKAQGLRERDEEDLVTRRLERGEKPVIPRQLPKRPALV